MYLKTTNFLYCSFNTLNCGDICPISWDTSQSYEELLPASKNNAVFSHPVANVKAEGILPIPKNKQKEPNLVNTGWKISASNDVKEMDETVTFDNKTGKEKVLCNIIDNIQ